MRGEADNSAVEALRRLLPAVYAYLDSGDAAVRSLKRRVWSGDVMRAEQIVSAALSTQKDEG